MNRVVLFLLTLFFQVNIFGQRPFVKGQKVYCWSETKSGLYMYEGPDLKTRKIYVLPYKAEAICLNATSDLVFADTSRMVVLNPFLNRTTWMEIEYKGISGFVTDFFISTIPVQSLDSMFNQLMMENKDTVIKRNGLRIKTRYEKRTNIDGASYKRVVLDHGGIEHIYFIPNIYLVESLMLVEESLPGDDHLCGLRIENVEGVEISFPSCTSAKNRSIKKVDDGIIIILSEGELGMGNKKPQR